MDGAESLTRCGACAEEGPAPCTALRTLALPYAAHPGYRPEWQLPEQSAERMLGGNPPPYSLIATMPPPGNARRRLLRQYGIRISRGDFTDSELALRIAMRRPRKAN
ncbi:DUF6221 family protein [Nocardioides lijunqiniae]|uniref:DUF6221 family protein n=1 Tax=Nocardioides lijunqiniae TaxID=2760832 RepID=UPI001D0C83B9